jgi:hypothetical protein
MVEFVQRRKYLKVRSNGLIQIFQIIILVVFKEYMPPLYLTNIITGKE